ncbi:MAG: hypothetical protein J0L75_00610 [Spirochaetes bacterium]|nr:hypothetical protein [Spirochaetota bacterium]
MKRLIWITLLALGLAPAANLFKNADFEKDLQGWNLFIPGESKDKGCTNQWAAGAGRNGGGAAFLQSKENARWGLSVAQVWEVAPGDRFQLRAWLRLAPGASVQAGTPGVLVRATVNSAENKPGDHPVLLPDSTVSSIAKLGAVAKPLGSEWRELSGVVTIPEGVSRLAIDIMPHYLKGGVYVDDVFLEKLGAASPAAGLLSNPGFEKGLEGWNNADDGGMTAVLAEAARGGKAGLRVSDEKENAGSSLMSAPLKVAAGKKIKLTFHARSVKAGDGLGVYLRIFDAAGKQLNGQPKEELVVPGAHADWKAYTLLSTAPAGAANFHVWVHSFGKAKSVVDLDDFDLAVE